MWPGVPSRSLIELDVKFLVAVQSNPVESA